MRNLTIKNSALVIEDDLSLKPLWEMIFRRRMEDWSVDWAISSEEGRRLCQKSIERGEPYSVVVVDLFLAGSETGLDFISSSEARDTHAAVILVSAIEERRIKDNFDEFVKNTPVLSKPLSVPKCERVLDKIFSQIAS